MKQRSNQVVQKGTSAPITSMDRHTSTKDIKPQYHALGG